MRLAKGTRALVIGGSMSGLLAALALRQHGWQADVYERVAEPLAGRGAGIVAQPELKAILRKLGLEADRALGVEVATRVMFARDGRLTHRVPIAQTMTAWDRVFFLLKAALPEANYHRGKELRRVEQRGQDVVAHFADGSAETADMLIGADGIRSGVRQQYLPEVAPLYAGYTAWRGLIAEGSFPAALHAALFDDFAFCLPDNEQMLGYPVAGPDNDLGPGHRRYNFVWYRPASEERELPRLLTDDSGRTHVLSIPPPLIARDVIAAMRDAAARVLAPQFNEMVSLCEMPFLQPIYDLEVPRMAFGRVALVGDAAFVARPHIGAGVAKAADDALALAQALAANDDVAAALQRFEVPRLDAGRRIVARTRHLGAYVQADLKSDAEREHAARHRTPEAVLTETAIMEY
ncbi:MAG: FAD-dependent oxidoreductase [Alphaproteobacteria bacterium]|nr:MAG: FAD-dependent oxidoreductase [Alphaproteobacteria bacterium]